MVALDTKRTRPTDMIYIGTGWRFASAKQGEALLDYSWRTNRSNSGTSAHPIVILTSCKISDEAASC